MHEEYFNTYRYRKSIRLRKAVILALIQLYLNSRYFARIDERYYYGRLYTKRNNVIVTWLRQHGYVLDKVSGRHTYVIDMDKVRSFVRDIGGVAAWEW